MIKKITLNSHSTQPSWTFEDLPMRQLFAKRDEFDNEMISGGFTIYIKTDISELGDDVPFNAVVLRERYKKAEDILRSTFKRSRHA